jgi:hypothetical protein
MLRRLSLITLHCCCSFSGGSPVTVVGAHGRGVPRLVDEIRRQQPCQRVGIYLIILDPGLGNQFGLIGVDNDHPTRGRPGQINHWPAMGYDLKRHFTEPGDLPLNPLPEAIHRDALFCHQRLLLSIESRRNNLVLVNTQPK